MNELTIKEALEAYTKDLIPTVLELLEFADCDQKLCNMVKSAIWNQKDASLNKIRDFGNKSKEIRDDYNRNYTNSHTK